MAGEKLGRQFEAPRRLSIRFPRLRTERETVAAKEHCGLGRSELGSANQPQLTEGR